MCLLIGLGLLLMRVGTRRIAQLLGALAFGSMAITSVFAWGTWPDLQTLSDLPTPSYSELSLLLAAAMLLLAATNRPFPQRPTLLVLGGGAVSAIGVIALAGFVGDNLPWVTFTGIALPVAVALVCAGGVVSLYGWYEQQAGTWNVDQLRRAIVIYSAGHVLLLALLSSVLTVVPHYVQLHRQSEARLKQSSSRHAASIEQTLDAANDIGRQIASRTQARLLLASYQSPDPSGDEPERLRAILRDALASTPQVVALARYDAGGQVVVTLDDHGLLAGASHPRADSNRELLLLSDRLYLRVRTEITDRDATVLGHDVMLYHAENLERLASRNPERHMTALTLLLPWRERDHVLRFDAVEGGYSFAASTERHTEFRHMAEDEPTVHDCESPCSTTLQRIASTGWVLAIEYDPKLYHMEMRSQIRMILAGIGVLALMGCIGIVLMVQPLATGALIEASKFERQVKEAVAQRVVAESEVRRKMSALQIAREIQFDLFPARAPRIEGLDVAAFTSPAEEVDGDVYDFLTFADGTFGVTLGDACGHGLHAALLSSHTQATLRSLAISSREPHPYHLLEQASRVLSLGVADNRFVTMIMVRIDVATRQLTWANAGHPTGYVLNEHGDVRAELISTRPPLSLDDPVSEPCPLAIDLQPRDLVLLLSDGVTEARMADGTRFSSQGALARVRELKDHPANEIVAGLRDTVLDLYLDRDQPMRDVDDVTAVVIKVGQQASPSPA